MRKWLAVVLLTISVRAFADEYEDQIPCRWESPEPEAQKILNTVWKEAQKAAGKKATTARPKICAREGAVPAELGGRMVLLCGFYNRERNDILACYDPEVCGPFRCILIHEFLHNIMGKGHEGHAEVMKRAGCDE